MRFSIVVPVYNVEEYLDKCLNSIKNQTFKDFEVIIVNDGSTDNSQKIIDKYVKENSKMFNCFIQKNQGLSAARNFGIEKSTGEYLFFIDSDDFIDENFLEILDENIAERKDLDLLRITIKKIRPNGEIVKEENFEQVEYIGEEAFLECRIKRIEIILPWAYCIKTTYWKENKFKFPVGRLHEDLRVMPILLLRAKKVLFVKGSFYIHLLRENSIMRTKDYNKKVKMAYDIIYNYDEMKKEIELIENVSPKAKKVFNEFISTAVFQQLNKLNDNDRIKYKEEIKKRKIIKNIKFYKGCIIRILGKKIRFRIMIIK